VPVPDFEVSETIVSELRRSEMENLVFKLNAGLRNENVKHDHETIRSLNRIVSPLHAEVLELFRLNDYTGTALECP
jgi:hypothetical protein